MFLVRQLARTPVLEWTRPWVEKTGTDISDPEALAEAPVLPAFPVARLRDLCTLQTLAIRDAARVRCPTLVAVAEQDHVVDPEEGGGSHGASPRRRRCASCRCGRDITSSLGTRRGPCWRRRSETSWRSSRAPRGGSPRRPPLAPEWGAGMR